MKDVDDRVFAVSLRIGFDPVVVGIDEDTGFAAGSFLGPDAIALFQVETGIMHLSITDVAGSTKALNSGSVGTVTIQGLRVGQCEFSIAIEDLRFIDSTGADVENSDFEILGLSLTVQ